MAAAAACTTANGGAVDLSWKLRPQSGATDDPNVPAFLDCSMTGSNGEQIAGPVAGIELYWEVGSASGHSDFLCTKQHDQTIFDLPPGTAALSIAPLCAGPTSGSYKPAAIGAYVAPAPVLRDVTLGAAISLGAVELIVNVAPNIADCTTMVSCICYPP